MATPHISAEPGDFAESILLPGDPLRAAVHRRDLPHRGPSGHRGAQHAAASPAEHDGMPVSVMGTGMGIPSASIYATELIRIYGVRRLVRVGSCGGIGPDARLRDVIVATGRVHRFRGQPAAVRRHGLRSHRRFRSGQSRPSRRPRRGEPR